MTEPRAIEYDQTPNRLLHDLSQNARNERLLRLKAQQENEQKMFDIWKDLNPKSLYSTFDKSVVNESLQQLHSNVAGFLKTNPNVSQAREFVNGSLTEIADWSANVAAARENIQKSLAALDPKSPFDRNRLLAAATDATLYEVNPATGQKVLKRHIDPNVDILPTLISNYPEKFIDSYKGEQSLLDEINNAPLFEEKVDNVTESPDGKKTIQTTVVSKLPFYMRDGDGKAELKKMKGMSVSPEVLRSLPSDMKKIVTEGYIDEGVFQRLYSRPESKVFIDAKANEIMQAAGLPEDSKELVKRAYLTSWLEQNAKRGGYEKSNKENYARTQKWEIYGLGGSGSRSADAEFMDNWTREIQALEENPNSEKIYDVRKKKKTGEEVSRTMTGYTLRNLSPDMQAYIANLFNKIAPIQNEGGFTTPWAQGDIRIRKEPDGNWVALGIRKVFNEDDEAESKSIRIPLPKLSVNVTTNQPLGQKAKAAAAADAQSSGVTYDIKGKSYTENDLKKLGYTSDQIKQALSAGTIRRK